MELMESHGQLAGEVHQALRDNQELWDLQGRSLTKLVESIGGMGIEYLETQRCLVVRCLVVLLDLAGMERIH